MVLRVVLLAQGGEELAGPPGRDVLVRDSHTFADLAAAIDRAFARWDLSHLHEFRLIDGRRIGIIDPAGFDDDASALDERKLTLQQAGLRPGDTFEYVFDFGDSWEHRCTVLLKNSLSRFSRPLRFQRPGQGFESPPSYTTEL